MIGFGFSVGVPPLGGIINSSGGSTPTLDPNAAAFIAAAGITNSTEIAAINTLTLSLKSNNLWNNLQVIYPFVGGTAASSKWNLKDPRDLDAAFRLSFYGGYTFSTALGIIPNGTNTYAQTYYSPLTNGTFGDQGVVLSISNDTAEVNGVNAYSWGCYQGTLAGKYNLFGGYYGRVASGVRSDAGIYQQYNPNTTGGRVFLSSASTVTPVDVYTSNWYPDNNLSIYKSKPYTVLGTYNAVPYTSFNAPANTYALNAVLQIDGSFVSTRTSKKAINFWGTGTSFTAGQSSTLISIIQTFNASLSRPT